MSHSNYISFSAVDVIALVKAFSAGVWYLTLSNIIALTSAYTLIVKEPTLEFSCNVVLSVITVRELQSAPTLRRTFSGTIITFLIGQIYSNSVMSSFLDPNGEIPHSIVGTSHSVTTRAHSISSSPGFLSVTYSQACWLELRDNGYTYYTIRITGSWLVSDYSQ